MISMESSTKNILMSCAEFKLVSNSTHYLHCRLKCYGEWFLAGNQGNHQNFDPFLIPKKLWPIFIETGDRLGSSWFSISRDWLETQCLWVTLTAIPGLHGFFPVLDCFLYFPFFQYLALGFLALQASFLIFSRFSPWFLKFSKIKKLLP
jgi:hypothetical protein